MRESAPLPAGSARSPYDAGPHLHKKIMDAERINALGTLIDDLRARTDALRGYL